MVVLKKLFAETAIYGLSSIVGRMVYFLLTPLYTAVLSKEAYGNVTELFSYTALLMVFFTYRMETAYFSFSTGTAAHKEALPTALWSVAVTSVVLGMGIIIGARPLAEWLAYSAHPEYIRMAGFILLCDALCEIPLAQLRLTNRPLRYVSIKLTNILVNVGCNVFFLIGLPFAAQRGLLLPAWLHQPDFGVGYIFLANVIASALTLVLLLPLYATPLHRFDGSLWRKMMAYALPLVIVGLAGIVNETLDRALFKWWSPQPLAVNEALLGEYGAAYKLTMLLTLFTQAFRMGAEPFFFKQRTTANAPLLYAKVLHYFSMATLVGLVFTICFLPLLRQLLLHPKFWVGLQVVPILLAANYCLALYYNVSVWYRVAHKTLAGAVISLIGAAITIILNYWWIPVWGYVGCAWATLVCYAAMVGIAVAWGQRHYPIPYRWALLIVPMLVAGGVCAASYYVPAHIFIYSLLFVGYVIFLFFWERGTRAAFNLSPV